VSVLTHGPKLSAREGEGPHRFGKKEDGPRATSGTRPEWRPRPFYSFSISFSFSVLPIL
jgi:hypothetical protein